MNDVAIPLIIGVVRWVIRINDRNGEARFSQDLRVGRRHVVVSAYQNAVGVRRGNRSQQLRVLEAAITGARNRLGICASSGT